MADPISIISRTIQDGCDKLLSDWIGELLQAQNPAENIKNRHYHDWINSHPVSARDLGFQTTFFKKMLDDDDSVKGDKYEQWRGSFENFNTLRFIDDLWNIVAGAAHSSKPLGDSSDGISMRLHAHVDSFGQDVTMCVAPQFSSILAHTYDKQTLSIMLPQNTGRLSRLSGLWAMATLKVFLFPNLLNQVDDREKRLKNGFLQRLGYEKATVPYEVLLRAMHLAPDFLRLGHPKTMREVICSEGDNIVSTLALLVSSVPHSFINHLQILKVLPTPQPILAQSLAEVLQTMIVKSNSIRAQRNGNSHQLFIDWLHKVFAREALFSLVEKVRLLLECCWTSGLHKRLLELSARSQEKDLDGLETECLQVLMLLRLQNSFLAFPKLLAPIAGSTFVINALESVCSSLQLLSDFHIFSRAAHERLKNRNCVCENVTLSDSLHVFSLPSIYPFFFENLRLPGSALPIPILISHEAVISIGNSETLFFSESFRVEEQTLALKPILTSPCDTSQIAGTQTCIQYDVKLLPSHDSNMVINWGTSVSENPNDHFLKAQRFYYWFIAVQCARVALWTFEKQRESGTGLRASTKITCAYRWFPKRAVHHIESFVSLCTQANECIRENAADVLRARGFNASEVTLETVPVLSTCVANIIAASANLLDHYDHAGPHSHRSSKHSVKGQLKIDNSAQLQDYVSRLCNHCHSLIKTSTQQVQVLIKLSSASCIAFQRHSLLFEDVSLDDMQAFDLRELDINESEAQRLDLMIRVCSADNMFLRLFDVFDHHSPLIQSNLFRLPGAGGIPFLNFPELRLRRLCERVHFGKLIKTLCNQLMQAGPLLSKFLTSYEKIKGFFGKDKDHILDHLLKPRSDMGGNCIVGKLRDGVADEQLVSVANSIWEQICKPHYSKRLDQLISAQYPIEFGIRLRLLVEPLCNILQSNSNKEFGADDIIPLTEFVFNFVFAPRAMGSSDAYLYWIAKLCTFKEMLNDEFAQSYLQLAEELVNTHTKNGCPHQNWQGDIPAVKMFIRHLLAERTRSSESGSTAFLSPFPLSSSDDDVESDAGNEQIAAAGDSMSASELAALTASPRMRVSSAVFVSHEDSSGSETNARFTDLTRSCIKRNSLLQLLHQANIVKTQMHLYKAIEDCLRSSEAIDWMMHIKVCDSRADAIRIGKLMVADGLISPVDHSKPFADKPLLFRLVKPVVFESSLIITWGFFDRIRYFAIYPKSSDFFTLCWFQDNQKTEVRGEICIYPSSMIRRVNELDIELSLVQEIKKGYGWIKENKCFSVRAASKQLRDRWMDELTQAQKRLISVPEPLRVDEKPRPSFFLPSSLVDTASSPELSALLAESPLISPATGISSDVLGSNISPIISARLPAVIELDHVFYRGAHMSFNDFLLTASSESEWYLIQFFSLAIGKWH